MGGETKRLGEGGGGPVHTDALGPQGNKGSQCDGNKGTLVHSQPGACRGKEQPWPWRGLGGSRLRLLLLGRVEVSWCQPPEWGHVLGTPYVRGRPGGHSFRRPRAAEGQSLCSPSHSFHLSDSCPLLPLDTFSNHGLSFSWSA